MRAICTAGLAQWLNHMGLPPRRRAPMADSPDPPPVTARATSLSQLSLSPPSPFSPTISPARSRSRDRLSQQPSHPVTWTYLAQSQPAQPTPTPVGVATRPGAVRKFAPPLPPSDVVQAAPAGAKRRPWHHPRQPPAPPVTPPAPPVTPPPTTVAPPPSVLRSADDAHRRQRWLQLIAPSPGFPAGAQLLSQDYIDALMTGATTTHNATEYTQRSRRSRRRRRRDPSTSSTSCARRAALRALLDLPDQQLRALLASDSDGQ